MSLTHIISSWTCLTTRYSRRVHYLIFNVRNVGFFCYTLKKKKGLVSLSRHDRTLEERRLSFFWMILFIIHWLLIPVHPLLLCFKYTKSFSFYSFFLVDRWNWFIHHKSSNLICSEWLLHHWESFVLFLNKIGAWHPWSNSPCHYIPQQSSSAYNSIGYTSIPPYFHVCFSWLFCPHIPPHAECLGASL